jgi:23S rRNA (cytidine2498-2'-O)-methyltransferase
MPSVATGRDRGVSLPTNPPILFSAHPESLALAMHEVRREVPDRTRVGPVGPDLAAITGGDLTTAELAQRCRDRPLVFVTHLTTEVATIAATTIDQITAAAIGIDAPKSIAVQAWISGRGPDGMGAGAVATAVTQALRDTGCDVGRAGREYVLSCCLTAGGVRLGLNRTADSLTDWPGGRVRLGRTPQQISRAEFKLEEVLQTFPIDLPRHGLAVDFGAAPGGWTRILRAHGLRVVAVDPGDLDPRIASDRGVSHRRTTAGEYLRTNDDRVDVIVNDMRMDPLLSCQLMVEAARHLWPAGWAVVTLKTGTNRILDTVHRCLSVLAATYQIIGARQLHHNRHEVTVVLRPASSRHG